MKLKYNEADMHAQLVRMLYPDEKVLFPVYCVFREKSFLPSFLEYGYIAVTDKDRLLTVRYDIVDGTLGACPLSAIKKLRIKKLLIGQYRFDFKLMTDKKDYSLSVQVSPTVAGGSFPHRYANLNMLISLLTPYITGK